MPEQLLGGYERTGVYLSRDDFAELKQVIKKAHVKDATLKRVGVAQLGAGMQSGSMLQAPSMGSMGIQDFMRQVVKNYGFTDSDRVLYGANNKGEILRWMTPTEVTDHRTKKGG